MMYSAIRNKVTHTTLLAVAWYLFVAVMSISEFGGTVAMYNMTVQTESGDMTAGIFDVSLTATTSKSDTSSWTISIQPEGDSQPETVLFTTDTSAENSCKQGTLTTHTPEGDAYESDLTSLEIEGATGSWNFSASLPEDTADCDITLTFTAFQNKDSDTGYRDTETFTYRHTTNIIPDTTSTTSESAAVAVFATTTASTSPATVSEQPDEPQPQALPTQVATSSASTTPTEVDQPDTPDAERVASSTPETEVDPAESSEPVATFAAAITATPTDPLPANPEEIIHNTTTYSEEENPAQEPSPTSPDNEPEEPETDNATPQGTEPDEMGGE